MSFLYPTFLIALTAVAIPVIIHLFNFRRYKTVYFTNVRFLREVKEQTDSRSRLKHLLVLISRILAIVFLVLAFAQPYFKSKTTAVAIGKKGVSVFIDNSFSMGQLSSGVPLLEQAKLKAREIVEAYGADDEFQLLTGDFEARHQRLVDKEEMLNLIKEVNSTSKSRRLSEVISRQKQALNKSSARQKVLFALSDFQRSYSDFESLQADSNYQINLIPMSPTTSGNVYIDTCWMESPVQVFGQVNTVIVRIVNDGDEPLDNARLTLEVNNQTKAISNFTVEGKSMVTDSISYTVTETGWSSATLSLIDHPVTFDDTYFFTYAVSEHINILVINESVASSYLNALFGSNAFFILQNVPYNQLNYADLAKYQFVILHGLQQVSTGLSAELTKFVQSGGNLLVFPTASPDFNTYNMFLAQMGSDGLSGFSTQKKSVNKLNNRDPFFADIFQQVPQHIAFPQANGSFLLTSRTTTTNQPLLTFSDGSSFLNKYSIGNGLFFLSAVPLDMTYTDFPVNPLFAPLIYKMAIYKESSPGNAMVIGRRNLLAVSADLAQGDQLLRLKGLSEEFIPSQRLIGNQVIVEVNAEISQSGVYSLEDPDGKQKSAIALNYDRLESKLSFASLSELQEVVKPLNMHVIQPRQRDIADVISGQGLGLPLWKVSVIFVLVFIALEIALLKFWK